MFDSDNPLSPVVESWHGRIERAKKAKKNFQDDADECMDFFAGPHDFMWDVSYKRKPWDAVMEGAPPTFRMTIAKVFELVALFGPVLYHRNPVRTVNPRKQFQPPIELFGNPLDPFVGPMVQMVYQQQRMQAQQQNAVDLARAQLMEQYLNYTPNEMELAKHMRYAITESLIKGRGVMVTMPYQPPLSERRMVGSFYDSVDNWQIDPDAEEIDDAKWVAQRCFHPTWEVERDYGLPAGTLKGKGTYESAWQQGEMKADDLASTHRQQGTSDLIEYWKIWSKMGMGGRSSDMPEELQDALEVFGDHCYLVIAKGVNYPLNLPSSLFGLGTTDDEYMQRVEWPVPFWKDDRWPCTFIDYYDKPRSVWPISPVQPGLGELKFMNYAMSWLANRIKTSCRTFIAHQKSLDEETKTALTSGADMTLLAVEAANQGIDKVVAFLNQPQVNRDIWDILTSVMQQFDKRVGLTELVYGMSSVQNRSAMEAKIKQENISVRPDYMAGRVEDAASELSRKEAMAIRLFVEPQDAAPVVGPAGAMFWGQLVNEADLDKVMAEMEYRVEAGTAKRPNRERDTSNIQFLTPMVMPLLQQRAAMTGDTTQLNNWLVKVGKAIDQSMDDVLLPPGSLSPPMPPPGMVPGPPPGNKPPEKQGQAA